MLFTLSLFSFRSFFFYLSKRSGWSATLSVEMLDDYWADDLLSVRWTRWRWVWWWWFSVYRGPPLSSKGMLRLRTSLAVGTLALGPSSFISLPPHLPPSPPSFYHAHTNTHAHLPSDLLELAARRAPAPMICHMIVGFDFSWLTLFSTIRSLYELYALQETFHLVYIPSSTNGQNSNQFNLATQTRTQLQFDLLPSPKLHPYFFLFPYHK